MVASISQVFKKGVALFLLIVMGSEMVLAAGLSYHDYITKAFSGRRFQKTNPDIRFDVPLFPVKKNAKESWNLNGKFNIGEGNKEENQAQNIHLSNNKKTFETSGPSQPEHSQFKPAGASNVVDLFTGDFSYNIPLMDVGGYPVSINYNSNISMDQEAGWVGLGWNINPGTISRNTRGLPDDFNGKDSIIQTLDSKRHITVGAGLSFSPELVGSPIKLGLGLAATYNNRTGFGVDLSINPSISISKANQPSMAGKGISDSSTFNFGLDLKLSNQEGAIISPSFSSTIRDFDKQSTGDISISTNFGTRTGLMGTSLQTGYTFASKKESESELKNQPYFPVGVPAGNLSFARHAALPTITSPYITKAGVFTLNFGFLYKVLHGSLSVTGHFSETSIDVMDKTQMKPAYGYLNLSKYQADSGNQKITDISREKETYYKDRPLPYNIAVPSYNYDVFTIAAEGTGGMFRPYRGDVGLTGEHYVKTKSTSLSAGYDLGGGSIIKGGLNVAAVLASSTTSEWAENNGLKNKLKFDEQVELQEPVYFKNPGEMLPSNQQFDSLIGKENLVKFGLSQAGFGSGQIYLKPELQLYKQNRVVATQNISGKLLPDERQPRTQVVTQYTVAEEQEKGNSFLVSYDINYFHFGCSPNPDSVTYISRGDNVIRKNHHIANIEVLQTDGRTYEYGLPVYTIENKEVEYSMAKNANIYDSTLTETPVQSDYTILGGRFLGYKPTITQDYKATEQYFKRTITPAHANSFLLTSLKSPDYTDITGDGPSEDDRGDAVKFNYTRVHYAENNGGFGWKTPLNVNANQNEVVSGVSEGLKTDFRDDRASYMYGRKEIWYLNSLESKTMVAAFVLEQRNDALGISSEVSFKETGKRLYRLKEIKLFSKSDLVANGMAARPIKVVHFEYDYSLCKGMPNSIDTAHGKLTLKKIWFTYNNNNKGKLNPYIFEYNNNQSYKRNWTDNWGNVKDPSNNPGNLLNNDYPYPVNNAALAGKSVNVAPWALKVIQLPGGSAMKVAYEADDYAYVQHKKAMQFFEIVKLGKTNNYTNAGLALYENENDANDSRYVFVKLPESINSKTDFFSKYLTGLDYLYIRIGIKMPFDPAFDLNNTQYEFVKLYARLEPGEYGMVPGIAEQNIGWIKLRGTQRKNTGTGDLSPITKASLQFLRNQLPSKAFPGSQFPTDEIKVSQFATALISAFKSAGELVSSFIQQSKKTGKCKYFLPGKAFIRLNHSGRGKIGGGYRVARVEMYDRWDSMANGKASTYGQEYKYTMQHKIGNKTETLSSGVASYEPFAGGEENPWKFPLENYDDQRNLLGPATTVFTEGPLMESFLPAPIVGYSKVRVRSIHHKNIKSQTGWDETEFYTAKDFPVITEDALTPIADGFKKFESPIRNFFKVNSKKFYAFSQGFKIELNDMHGKMKSQASYAFGDSVRPITKTTYYYKSSPYVNGSSRLECEVFVADRKGNISTRAIGRNIEVMTDLRNQESRMFSGGVQANFHFFNIGVFPVLIPRLLKPPQWEETYYRAAAVTKVVNKTGILDSVLVVDKGSVVSTKNLVYDAVSGQVVITRTNNEFDDPVFNFNMPAHWAYDRMGPAYRNMKASVKNAVFTDGKLDAEALEKYFVPGDEVVVTNIHQPDGLRLWVTAPATDTADKTYTDPVSTYPDNNEQYSNLLFVTREGKPFSTSEYGFTENGYFPVGQTGTHNVDVKIVKSGRINLVGASVGSVQSLKSPITNSKITIDSTIQVLSAGAVEMKEDWRVQDNYWVIDSCMPVCNCPDGYDFNQITGLCNKILEDTAYVISQENRTMQLNPNESYTNGGVRLFDTLANNIWNSSAHFELIDTNTPFWSNPNFDTTNGRLNKVGLWLGKCTSCSPIDSFIGIVRRFTAPESKIYYIGVGGTHDIRLNIDCEALLNTSTSNISRETLFKYWHIFPKYFTAGEHIIDFAGLNRVEFEHDIPYIPNASFGMEIYNNSRSQIESFKNEIGDTALQIVFSTSSLEGINISYYQGKINCPSGSCHLLNDKLSTLKCVRILTDTPLCIAQQPIIDTLPYINSYFKGILGNYRPYKSYAYYADRAQTNPTVATNIRTNGAIAGFTWFWKNDGSWFTPQHTGNWLANVENTLYDRRGMSIETKDPLNRYTSGQYGYLNTLPVAVTQNSKNREAAFDGFEDYGFKVNPCADTCQKRIKRHFDWSKEKERITDTLSHSGYYSLRVGSGDSASFESELSVMNVDTNRIWIRATEDGETKTTSTSLLPLFSPTKGDSILVSTWLRESLPCGAENYSNSLVSIEFYTPGNAGLSAYSLEAAGPVIEGWQRFEAVIAVSNEHSHIRLKMKSTGEVGNHSYFDDIRIHPYYSNMKSFVYDPVSLRLMAELDENNYATFYEYDDDGTLIRVKKETEKGIMTIKETRSALLKN